MKKPLPRGRISHNPSPLVATAFVNLVLLSILGVFSWLRDQPLFWRNVGGWPIWLRDLVGGVFYPLFFLELGFLFALTAAVVRCLNLRCSFRGPAIVSLALLWGLWLVMVMVVLANNLDNLFSGRPLHWHPG